MEPSSSRMVERLRALAEGPDRERSPFVNSARLEELLARRPRPDLQSTMLYRGQLSEQLLYSGRFQEAADSLASLMRWIDQEPAVPEEFRRTIEALLASTHLKREEQEVCVELRRAGRCLMGFGPDTPRPPEAPGRAAVEAYLTLLEEHPGDPAYRWLLNVGYMLLGEYPGGVPGEWRIEPATFAPEFDVGRFVDRAPELGLDVVGHAGGAALEDFDGDGDLDAIFTSWSLHDAIQYYENEGDGTFSDRTAEAGLDGLVGGLNLTQADYDNDGDLDVFVLRGAWLDYGQPNSLLRNRGDGSFDDVTYEAGLAQEWSTQTATWADFDLDGWVDLYVGNESVGTRLVPNQLFRNNGDGTFTDVAEAAGAAVVGFVKGVVSGDLDDDGRPDLYVSRLGADNVLLLNTGLGEAGEPRFVDATAAAGVAGPVASFPAWIWDYDNDGRLDLYVSGYKATVGDVAAEKAGLRHDAVLPVLYRNMGGGRFDDVTAQVGLDRIQYVMGTNFGDLDNDGYLDFYVGTGDPDFEAMMPNRVFRNDEGRRFQEVTGAGSFGHIQKGHAVSFGDVDNDGDQDLFINMGGATEADLARNMLLENPGHGRHWVTLRLEGDEANRAAIGARVRVTFDAPGGRRSVHRVVGPGASFGANSLQLEIGLGDATALVDVGVRWPGGAVEEVFRGVTLDSVARLVQGSGAAVPDDAPAFRWPAAGGS